MIVAPAHPREQARLEALRNLHLLDTPPEERFEQLTRIAMRALGTPMASVSLIDADRQWCKSSPGMAKPSVDRAISFCGLSMPTEFLAKFLATIFVVPEPAKGSSTQSPSSVKSLINHSGSARGNVAECFLFPHSVAK